MTEPTDAMLDDQLLGAISQMQQADLPTHGGRTLAYVYDAGIPGLDELAAAAYATAMHANALDPTAFPSVAAMEGDLVATAAGLVGGGPDAAGTVTSGGTESCMLAVAAARDGSPHISEPRMVIASSAHAAFHKAAHYFGVEIDMVDVDPTTLKADPDAMAQAMGPDTVLVVVSAPSYAHGVIDPVAHIAGAAQERGIRCHVDGCIGGWILGCWRRIAGRIGREIAPFGLDVPGVTSISIDLHKYAYAPKGTSVLLHADASLRSSQFFVTARWPGYAMLNTTMQSTRSGGPIAAAWAVVNRLGRSGYDDVAERTAAAMDEMCRELPRIKGLRLLTEPEATLIALASTDDGPSVFDVADEMTERGFYIQPQFAFGELPATLHITITAANFGREKELITALTQSALAAAQHPSEPFGDDVVAALLQADLTSPAGLAAVAEPLGLISGDGSLALPTKMAPINALLNALPAQMREQILRGVLSMLISHGRDLL